MYLIRYNYLYLQQQTNKYSKMENSIKVGSKVIVVQSSEFENYKATVISINNKTAEVLNLCGDVWAENINSLMVTNKQK